jgi:hypothetical protein
MSEPLYDDPVVAEIHAIRAKMLAECGGDHRKLMEQVRAREVASDRRVIPAPPPPLRETDDSTGAAVHAAPQTPAGR